MGLHSLAVSLMLSTGPMGRPGRLRLALRLAGLAGRAAGGSVAAPDGGVRDVDLTDAEFRELLRLAEEAGLPGRDPRVEAVVDTSDTSNVLLLRLAHEKGAHVLDLPMMASGYDGPDAPALRRFCGALLSMAGVRDGGVRHVLGGEAR